MKNRREILEESAHACAGAIALAAMGALAAVARTSEEETGSAEVSATKIPVV
jgi:hypothetical protein